MSREKNNETVRFEDVEFKARSPKAVLVYFGTGEAHWIPLSQVADQDHDSIEVTLWIAKQKGLA